MFFHFSLYHSYSPIGKMAFDSVCRVILFDICKRHGLAVEEEPDPGNRGRSYLMKNDYIIQKQKKLITEQETAIEEKAQALEAVSLRLEDAEALIDEVTEIAYAPDKSSGKRTQKVKIVFNFLEEEVEVPEISEPVITETTYGRRKTA